MSQVTLGELLESEFQPGYQLGIYALLERLGFGGQAVVWSAWDARHERVVAIKFVPAAASTVLVEPSSFMRETQVVANLRHPNILPIYDIGVRGKYDYLVMRYMCSGSLQGLLKSGSIPLPDALPLTAQVVSALEYIHMRDIVHRDLKPSNILLDSKRHVFLTDFGLARPLSRTTQALHTGQGTAPYAPPEQHTRSRVTHASDIYSLGILVYEMLTGILPWGGDFALAIRQLDAAEELPDPRDLNPELPSGLAGALRQLTAANAADRPASATEALRLVVKALQDDAAPALENVRVTPVPRLEDDSWVAEDAEFLMRRAMDGWDPWTKRFKFRSTHFWLVDSVYSQAKRHGLTLDDAHYQFMLRGALTYGRNLDFWWQKLADSRARLQVCEQAIANEGETAVARALARMLDEPGAVPRSEDALNALIELSAEAAGPEVRSNALNVLARSVDANTRWQAVGFTPTGDKELASLALSDSREANRAARLIGRARSETAVQAMVRAQGGPEAARILPALMEVRDAAGSLPDSTPALLRFRVGAELARRQLLEDRATLTRAYVAAGLGSALGLGFTVYATFRLPSYLDAKRILDAAGSGLLFGLVIGLGIFLTRLIAHRLRVLPLWAREALGIGVGALMINLGIVSYHNLFLDSAPVGWLIALGSFLVALGFGVGAALARSRLLSALVSATAIGMGLGLSWHLALRTGLTPMLYYELDRPVQTVFLIAVSSLLMGSVAHIVDLSKE